MTQMTSGGYVPAWTLGDRLRKAREEARIDAQEFAKRIGVSRRSIYSWEHDEFVPRRPTLLAWSMATNVRLGWLIDGTGEPEPDGGLPHLDSNQEPSVIRQLALVA